MFKFVDTMIYLINPISWTVKGVRTRTVYPTVDGTSINNIDAFVATENSDSSETYIHVLKPDGKSVSSNSITIPLPADNRDFKSATLAINGKAVEMQKFSDSIRMTLPQDKTFNSVDTVIRLHCN